jgi:hypothetical protein
VVASHGYEPDQDGPDDEAVGAAPDRWPAYPVFVLVLVATALLATFGPAALLWPLLSAALVHSHH